MAILRMSTVGSLIPQTVRQFAANRLRELTGVFLLASGVYLTLAFVSWNTGDPSLNNATAAEPANWLGHTGAIAADLLGQSLGLAGALLIVIAMVWGSRLVAHRELAGARWHLALALPGLIAAAAALAALPVHDGWPLAVGYGGIAGAAIHAPLSALITALGLPASGAVAGFLCAIIAAFSLIPALDLRMESFVRFTGAIEHVWIRLSYYAAPLFDRLRDIAADRIDLWRDRRNRAAYDRLPGEAAWADEAIDRAGATSYEDEAGFSDDDKDYEAATPRPRSTKRRVERIRQPMKRSRRDAAEAQPTLDLLPDGEFQLPALNLLTKPKHAKSENISDEALEQNARLLESVLEDFGVRGEIIKVRPGPVVTLYELEPAPGIKSSRVIGLADDIARSMSAVSARVAVVPGRNVIGIELPNTNRETVFLRELLASAEYEKTAARLTLALGKTIGGEAVIGDLARMPHLLIAGTTGSGKSVGINAMILSLLYRLSPDQCKLIMIDPKMLELSVYDGIPHLLTPVVTDPKKAVVALKWVVREMEGRYKQMSKLGVRNMEGFNTRVQEAIESGEILTRTVQTGFDRETGEAIYEEEELEFEPMPFIVVVIDEMADLMLVAGKEIEALIQRLAQMARAAGIHIITATQRPSVDVITGTIKANLPTRISFQVTSKIDSRTILGEQGAEQLLGQGDMLYMAGGGRIRRVHGPFVSDDEVEKVVRFLKKQGIPEYIDDITAEPEADGEGFLDLMDGGSASEADQLYDRAVAIVARDRKASTSYIQRKLQIGYNRAANIMERMEDEGVVSPPNHAGKREILVNDVA